MAARRGRATLTAAIASTPTCRVGSFGPFHVRRYHRGRDPPPPRSCSASLALGRRRRHPALVRPALPGRSAAVGDPDGHRRRGGRRGAAARPATSASPVASTPRTSSRTTPTARSCCAGRGSRSGTAATGGSSTSAASRSRSRFGRDSTRSRIDADALDIGLVVVPRESVGTAADAPDRVPGRARRRRRRSGFASTRSPRSSTPIVLGVPTIDRRRPAAR